MSDMPMQSSVQHTGTDYGADHHLKHNEMLNGDLHYFTGSIM